MPRGARQSPRLTVIYWRDIPTQVKVRAGRERVSAPLPDRFMVAVDGAATVAGKTTTDEYLAEWREKTRPCGDDLQAEADREVERIEEDYPQDSIRALVRNGGWASQPERPAGDKQSNQP